MDVVPAIAIDEIDVAGSGGPILPQLLGRPRVGLRPIAYSSSMVFSRRVAAGLVAIGLLSVHVLGQQAVRVPDTVYLPTPDRVVATMLRMANVGGGDVVYDLGSGDGRIVIAAVKEFGAAHGVGVELDAARIREANENARRAGVADRVEFRRQDLFETDLHPATVVTLYLGAGMNQRLRPKLLAELDAGARIVSHAFDMGGDWPALETQMVDNRPVFLWKVEKR
jgi:precorrin-6B methylase 2